MYSSGRFFNFGDSNRPPGTVYEVFRNAGPKVRRKLAESPSTPEDILLALAMDSDPTVRAGLAKNRAVPLAMLEQLASDDDVSVRLKLAEESALPPHILRRLCQDLDPQVQVQAQATFEGVTFEKQLKNEGFVRQEGNTARLGELLIVAGVVTEDTITESLGTCELEQLPLGRILVRENRVDSGIIIRALKLQSLVRNGKITLDSAVEKLARATSQRRLTTREMQLGQ